MTLSLELWLPPLVAGLSLLLVGGVWRAAVRDRRRRRSQSLLHVALSNADPLVRLAAVQVAVQQGISPVAGVLLQATRHERDPAVLEGITEAVARHQWEPSLEPELLELRLWAQRRLVELRHDQRGRPAYTNGLAHEPAATAPAHTNGVAHEPSAPVPAPAPRPVPGGMIGWLLGDGPSQQRSRRRG